tara:strand:- start:2644 stop:3258 length:615 start_codon:yes stop_codon:yes gene_type:complete
MRIKSFYSANEITTNLYTTGLEYMTLNNVEYIGLYHKYATKEVYTQSTWNPRKSVKLIKYKTLDPKIITYNRVSDINLRYKSFKTYNVAITKQNIVDGFVNRYIIKKSNEIKFFEVNKKTYEDFTNNKIDPTLYNAVKIKWSITGDIDTVRQDTLLILGVRDKNTLAITGAEKKLPNLSTYLTNPLQYYSDNDNVTPADINGLD